MAPPPFVCPGRIRLRRSAGTTISARTHRPATGFDLPACCVTLPSILMGGKFAQVNGRYTGSARRTGRACGCAGRRRDIEPGRRRGTDHRQTTSRLYGLPDRICHRLARQETPCLPDQSGMGTRRTRRPKPGERYGGEEFFRANHELNFGLSPCMASGMSLSEGSPDSYDEPIRFGRQDASRRTYL